MVYKIKPTGSLLFIFDVAFQSTTLEQHITLNYELRVMTIVMDFGTFKISL